MAEIQNINWFPGHMAKTRRLIKDSLGLIDAVVEIVDARIPVSSRNPEIDVLVSGKPRIMLLNKSDVADETATKKWAEHFNKQGYHSLIVDCRSGKGLNRFIPLVGEVLKDVTERNREKGMVGKPLRLMIVGIPNVGKSSFINRMAGRTRAKVADRPGVTRGNQWFTVSKGIEMMDTPGVLWAKFEDALVGENLAFTGAIKDEIMDSETLAIRFIERVRANYPEIFDERYNIGDISGMQDYEVLEAIGKKRGMLIRGGEIDTERASVILLDEFRGGKLGRLTIESI